MKSLQGIVINVIDAKTVKVEVARNWQHPVYKKYVKRTKSYLADVADNMDLEVGSEVVISECRPLSKRKSFKVTTKVA